MAFHRTYKYMTELNDKWNYPITEPPSTTILMPTYNEAAWLKKALESLENQNTRYACIKQDEAEHYSTILFSQPAS